MLGGASRSRTGLNGFAGRGITALLSRHTRTTVTNKKGKATSACFPFLYIWSGKRVSNSRPQPWQGCALPTELFPREEGSILAILKKVSRLILAYFLARICGQAAFK
jgi:hypothetical protein